MDHLVSSQVKCDDDDDHTTVTEPTNNKMDMSHVDFGNKKTEEKEEKNKSDNCQEDQCFKVQHKNEKNLSSLSIINELDSQVFPKSDQSISIWSEGYENRDLIDWMKDDNYIAVLNYIDVIDEMLQDHNNVDT